MPHTGCIWRDAVTCAGEIDLRIEAARTMQFKERPIAAMIPIAELKVVRQRRAVTPDYGFPPVHCGGWGATQAVRHKQTADQITAVAESKNTRGNNGDR